MRVKQKIRDFFGTIFKDSVNLSEIVELTCIPLSGL